MVAGSSEVLGRAVAENQLKESSISGVTQRGCESYFLGIKCFKGTSLKAPFCYCDI